LKWRQIKNNKNNEVHDLRYWFKKKLI